MEHAARAIAALSFAALAFMALFHSLVIREVYPGNSGEFRVLSPLLAGIWAFGIVEAWNSRAGNPPFLALGYLSALAAGVWLAMDGAILVAFVFVAASTAGLMSLSLGYFLHLKRPHFRSGEAGAHLLKHAGGEKTVNLRKAR